MSLALERTPITHLQSHAHDTRNRHFIQHHLRGQRRDASLMISANNLISWYQNECKHGNNKKKKKEKEKGVVIRAVNVKQVTK